MKISLVQSDIFWEDKKANFRKYESLLAGLKGNTDLVVLPEMFSTGFSMNSRDMAEDMDGLTLEWMESTSSAGNFGLIGSFIATEGGKYYNRLVFMKPGGDYCIYDKGHLFRMEKEDLFYTKGNRRVTEPFRGANFSLQICYDLRFPVWSRNRNNSYDILIYIANWPAARRKVWTTLLPARAIENQCYVIGVNRVGRDGNGIDYCGDSMIIGPRGDILAAAEENEEEVVTYELSLSELEQFREKFPVWRDADDFRLISG
ncbi:MAG: amidohydrolase [Bacteroidales bacterium]|nr:amidohydrolase [Bacteroidales bacterium]